MQMRNSKLNGHQLNLKNGSVRRSRQLRRCLHEKEKRARMIALKWENYFLRGQIDLIRKELEYLSLIIMLLNKVTNQLLYTNLFANYLTVSVIVFDNLFWIRLCAVRLNEMANSIIGGKDKGTKNSIWNWHSSSSVATHSTVIVA
ncbi:unnamed protein product [Thelazia callipaeda]|uniref:BZIP domain-containing protein n=1 Tax=Thelazia callipaeda TaxID=103827 RepID=A0A0N5DA95_THECL|nr:unnamed protein product [Thelazia callipaeda]